MYAWIVGIKIPPFEEYV